MLNERDATGLTDEELLRVKQFARLVLLQLVGFVHTRSQRAIPVYPSLAQALRVQSISHHPQQRPSVQRAGVGPRPQRRRLRAREEDQLGAAVELVLRAGGRRRAGGGRRDATSLRAAGGDLLHQRLSVVEGHVQAVV